MTPACACGTGIEWRSSSTKSMKPKRSKQCRVPARVTSQGPLHSAPHYMTSFDLWLQFYRGVPWALLLPQSIITPNNEHSPKLTYFLTSFPPPLAQQREVPQRIVNGFTTSVADSLELRGIFMRVNILAYVSPQHHAFRGAVQRIIPYFKYGETLGSMIFNT
ncbi:unnamed protein product, partial [Ectocarpus sp. 13 AM-2016]